MKQITLLCSYLLLTIYTYAQDSTAIINTSWISYATNPNLTYKQIVTTCDSLFALAGYPDTTDNEDTDTGEYDDRTPYAVYAKWKTFWVTRCDVNTGMLHSFATDAIAALNGSGLVSRTPLLMGLSSPGQFNIGFNRCLLL